MEKCLHYFDNNTKLDSSEIFPSQPKEKEKERGKREEKKVRPEKKKSKATRQTLYFFSRFFHFVVFWSPCTIVYTYFRWFDSALAWSIHFDWLLCYPQRLYENPKHWQNKEWWKKTQHNIKYEAQIQITNQKQIISTWLSFYQEKSEHSGKKAHHLYYSTHANWQQ